VFGPEQPVLSHHTKELVDAGVLSVSHPHRWADYAVAPAR
jgi:hypothetical protein